MTEGVTEVYRDKEGKRRIECWTDGTWVKLGRDVESDKCVEFRLENFPKVEGKLRYFDGGAEKFKLLAEYGGDESYIVYDSYKPRVIRDDEVVLMLGDDGYPLYSVKGLALDQRDDMGAEDIARGYVESLRPYAEIQRCSQRGLTGKVHVTISEGRQRVNLRFLDELRDEGPIKDGSVKAEAEDHHVCYKFVVLTDAVVDAPDA